MVLDPRAGVNRDGQMRRSRGPVRGGLSLPVALVGSVAAVCVSVPARAFTIETVITAGCHEMLTTEALAALGPGPDGIDLYTTIPLDDRTRRLRDALGIAIAQDLGFVGMSMVAGVRWNDLMGADPLDTVDLHLVHTSDTPTHMHCIRSDRDDGPAGSARAIQRCRQFIVGEIASARAASPGGDLWAGLDALVTVPEYLEYVGTTEVEYAAVGFHLGRALHAVQDSHTHGFRLDDQTIAVVVNWREMIRRTLSEAIDGPPHITDIDRCELDHPLIARSYAWALEHSQQFLEIALSGNDGQLQQFLDDALRVQPGCSLANDWCHPDVYMQLDGDDLVHGCRIGNEHSPMIGLLVVFALRRRRTAALLGCVAGMSASGSSLAAASRSPTAEKHWFGEIRTFGSVHRPALGVALEAQYGWTRAAFGVGVEWNPWVSTVSADPFAGLFSSYVTGQHRLPLGRGITLRQRVSLGLAVLLASAFQHRAGAVGVMLEVGPLAAELALGGGKLALVLDGFSIATPAVSLEPLPLVYVQYRIGLGLRF